MTHDDPKDKNADGLNAFKKRKEVASKMKKGMKVPKGETSTKHGFSGTENMNEQGGNTGIKPKK